MTLIYLWLPILFIIGLCVGSFLNVCIYRLPLEKSILWPGSHCGKCFRPIRWFDNVPILGYLLLRGRCRNCGQRFSIRYLLVELFTGLAFAGLFYLEVVQNIHGWQALDPKENYEMQWGLVPLAGWVVFGFHALLFSLLLVASLCDLDRWEIPLSVTMPGTLLGLVGAVLFPWPWPYPSVAAATAGMQSKDLPPGVAAPDPWWLCNPHIGPKAGLYPWPVWEISPLGIQLEGWPLGLATGVAGALVGTLLLRAVRFLFSKGMGVEALGLGDADLMMMAGAFLGWQAVAVAFFVAVFPALLFGVGQLLFRGDNAIPFGPSLAIGLVITWLGWKWIGPYVHPLLWSSTLLLIVVIVGALFMFGISFLMRRPRQQTTG